MTVYLGAGTIFLIMSEEKKDADELSEMNESNGRLPPVKQYCGGLDGTFFDDGANKKILEITIEKSQVVNKISLWYEDGSYISHGGDGGFKEQKISFRHDECVVSVTVCMDQFKIYHDYNLNWEENYVIYDLILKTNLGRVIGGGCKEREYDEKVTFVAPSGYGLTGIFGRKGDFLHGFGVHWCDVSKPIVEKPSASLVSEPSQVESSQDKEKANILFL